MLGFWLAGPGARSPALVLVADPWHVPLFSLLALVSAGLIFLWPHPFEFGGTEPTRVGHDSLAIIALVSALLGAVTAFLSRRRKS